MMRINSALLAFVVAVICTLLVVGYSCQTDSHESCLMSQGMGVYLLGIFFLVWWAIIGSVKAAFRFPDVARPYPEVVKGEPPILLEGARVLRYAGKPGGDSRFAICQSLVSQEVFLLRCDASWNVRGAERFASLESARKSAESSDPGIAPMWISYRALSEEEQSYVEATRSHLLKSSVPG